MYGIPQDFDSQDVFLGRRMSSVTFAENLISLVFDGDVVVTVFGSISYRETAAAEERNDQPPVSTSSLVAFIGQAVVTSKVDPPRRIILGLEGGGSLLLSDDSDIY